MSKRVEKTIRVLSSSKGKAARQAMHFAISSSEPTLSFLASREVLKTNSPAGIFEMVKRYNQLTVEQQELLAADVDKLGSPIRMALLNTNPAVQDNAITVIRKLRPYSLIPLLLQHLELGGSNHLGIVQWAISLLVNYFYQEFQGHVPRKASYGYTLTEISDALERGFSTWRRHEREIFFDVFFRLSERFGTLGDEFHEVMANPSHPAHAVFNRKLVGSQDLFVLRFLIRQLESMTAPNSLLVAAARRTDRVFIRMLLETVGYSPPVTLQENLAKIRRFDWLNDVRSRLDELDGGCHRFLVKLVRYSGMTDDEKLNIYETVLKFGSLAGKTVVVEQLQQVKPPDGNRLILLATESDEPEIQAVALTQLRVRNIKGATSRLLRFIDSPHPAVRKVVAEELTEFRMDRLLPSLDSLSDEQRDYMLRVIKKIDPKIRETIARELENPHQRHKDFLLNMIQEERTVVTYETSLMKLVESESDLSLRLKAVKLLAFGIHEMSRRFLKTLADGDGGMEIRILAQRVYEIRNMTLKREN